jgi:hypothetical protein
MALTYFQRSVCRLLARSRVEGGESYVAGGAALNESVSGQRVSRDLDLFHDSEAALEASWTVDRILLEAAGLRVSPLRERPSFIEAEVAGPAEVVVVEWARDSAFRFFPLETHPDFGLTLHPLDLATNKLLALVGRREVRDWIDILACDERIQPLGYLAWAACAKDPGFNPRSLVDHASRSGRYSAPEVAELAFEGTPPDAGELSRKWHRAIEEARVIIDALPSAQSGTCVLVERNELCRISSDRLPAAVEAGQLSFLEGSIRGVLPTLRTAP